MQPADQLRLCQLDELGLPDSRGFTVACGDRRYDIFLVRTAAGVFCYLNSCPHTGAPLDWMPNQFLSPDQMHIQCATHAALFQPDDGLCIAGPCHGEALKAVPVLVDTDTVYLLQRAFCAGRGMSGSS